MTTTNSLRVRMYRQGLGDCFLLSVTTGGASPTTRHVLVDCGVLLGTPDAKARMSAVAADVVASTGGHLDVLVVTHEHWDHVSGFVQAQDVLAGLTVGEVWLGWTEDPDDPLAQSLRGARQAKVKALTGAAQALAASGSPDADRLLGLLGFYGELALSGDSGGASGASGATGPSGASGTGGGRTTADALAWARGRSSAVRYLSPGTSFDALGVRVYVLGPPRDKVMLGHSGPDATPGEVYVGFAGADAGFLAAALALTDPASPVGADRPFDAYYCLTEADAAAEYPLIGQTYGQTWADWRRIDQDWLGAADQLALQLDSDTNNTSLVLAFEVGDGGVLLFPADAQVGNWLSWHTLTWTTDTGPVTTPDLLARTRLYKVGHHGSHNATLREKGLELMTGPDLVAMLPVNRATAAKQKWNMPLRSLMEALETRTRGRILDAELGPPATRPVGLDEATWQDFLARTDVHDLWVDHTITW